MSNYTYIKNAIQRKHRNIKRFQNFKRWYKLFPVFYSVLFLIVLILIISGIVWLFANLEWFELKSKNELGDAFGGLTNPIVAFIGVIVTFLAFYIQYTFNKEQSARIDNEATVRAKDKEKLDLEARRNYFDKKFYQLLEIHNKNVENITVKTHKDIFKGRESFEKIIDELHIAIALLSVDNEDIELNKTIKKAYELVFSGILSKFDVNDVDTNNSLFEIFKISNESNKNEFYLSEELRKNNIKQIELRFPDLKIYFLKGHSSYLSIYFRFLFMFVKFIDDENEGVISYTEKRHYLKILRSQMSNTEQMMLFYNWLSGYGEPWLNERNKYLTDYRIIHNIYTNKLFPGISLKDLFDKYKPEMRRLHEKDYLFDEDSWEDE